MPAFLTARPARLPALLCVALFLCACQPEDGLRGFESVACDIATTPIAAVQGDGYYSPIGGQAITVHGVVTFLTGDGLYLESRSPDTDESTSEGLFIDSPELSRQLATGDLVTLGGTVAELGEHRDTLTALTRVTRAARCDTGLELPVNERRLPLSNLRRESSESMRVVFRQDLVVTGVYGLSDGQVRLSAGGILPAPTEVAFPGDDARQQGWHNRQNLLIVHLPGDRHDAFPMGSTAVAVQGVQGQEDERSALLLDTAFNPTPPPAPAIPLPELDTLRAVSLNLHNYFNGDGNGRGFPAARGARTGEAFQAQRQRLVAAVRAMQPHLVAVVELENDGFGPTSAAADLARDLTAATRAEWRSMAPETHPTRIGTDEIRVGLFYRPDLLAEQGPVRVLETQPFRGLNRPPLAQAFRHRESGVNFVVAVNHLKSKGSCPPSGPDADNRDGTSCWNRARAAGAQAMVDWVNNLAGVETEGRALILGDLNAYRLEEPIARIKHAGYDDLTASVGPRHEYTFVYYGESGTLDYAFATASLRPYVWKAQVLKMNADFPPRMDLAEDWMRFSDHDPVIVDLRFSQASTSP